MANEKRFGSVDATAPKTAMPAAGRDDDNILRMLKTNAEGKLELAGTFDVGDITVGAVDQGDPGSVAAPWFVEVTNPGDFPGGAGGLTDAQLRATPVPVTDTGVEALLGALSVAGAGDATGSINAHARQSAKVLSDVWDSVNGRVIVDGSEVTQPVSGPLTDTQLRATPVPVSGTVTATGPLTDTQLRATAVPVSGPLTDTQLRATPVPVSGTVTATGPLTDTQLRATAVPVSGPLTDTQLRATAVPVSGTVTATGPLTDTQLRATAVPVSGTVTAAQATAASLNMTEASAASQLAVQGSTSGAAVVTDANGTIQQYLRGIVKILIGGVASILGVQGTVADDSPTPGPPVTVGGLAKSPDGTAPGTAVAEDDVARFITDLERRQFVATAHPTSTPKHWDATTKFTDEQIAAAPGAGFVIVITRIQVSTGAATALNLFLEEGSTKIHGPIYLEAVAGRGYVSGPMHLRCTANTAVTFSTSADIAQSIDITYEIHKV